MEISKYFDQLNHRSIWKDHSMRPDGDDRKRVAVFTRT